MELELKKLEDLSEAIVNDFAYMRAREEEMRDTNGRSFCLFVFFPYAFIYSFILSLFLQSIYSDCTVVAACESEQM